MNYLDLLAQTANVCFIISYVLVLVKILSNRKTPYHIAILSAVSLYAVYALINALTVSSDFYPMLAMNIVNMFFSTRTIYRLKRHPGADYKTHPVWFHVILVSAGIILAVATKAEALVICTWVGGGFFLSAYSLLSSKKINERGFIFNFMYLLAAGLWITWGIATNNKPIIIIETFVIIVSTIAILWKPATKLIQTKINQLALYRKEL